MKEIFSYGNMESTAYMNFRTKNIDETKLKGKKASQIVKDLYEIHNMNIIASGFFKSALILIDQCLEDNFDYKADNIIFPILFSVNHAIEVYIKSISCSMKILLNENDKYAKNHCIKDLWDEAKRRIEAYGFAEDRKESKFRGMIENLEAYLDELTEKILEKYNDKTRYRIDFSRYPTTTNNTLQFYLKTYDYVTIDLENSKVVFEDIYDCLSTLANFYYDKAYDEIVE